jgi:hypothetical protein
VVALALGGALPAAAGAAPKHKKGGNGGSQAPNSASPFAWRGIIEGFYGTPWTHGDRTRMLAWMGDHGFNAYVHAPKGDVYETSAWRQPYPAAVQANFDKEIAQAADEGVQWVPNVSPARGSVNSPDRICFSCPGDLDALLAKLGPFLAAGAHTVMVSFDDIAPELGPTDMPVYSARFPGTPPEYRFGRATAEFLNALRQRLPAGDKLLTVLPDYAGTDDSPYLQGARDGALDPAIGVLWTGRRIRASLFSPTDAAAYGQLIGRTPIVWENWVTRDFVPSRIFLGPFNGRSDVAHAVQGFFFNPMNEPDLNMLPLATAADWMRDPERYQPDASWAAAVSALAHAREPLADELRAFAETSYSSGLLRTEAPTSTRLANALMRAYLRGARWTDAAAALRAELRLVRRARTGLRDLPNRHFAREAAPFLAAAARLARLGMLGVDLLAAERPSLRLRRVHGGFTGRALPPDAAAAAELRDEITLRSGAAQRSPVYVFGCRVVTRGCGAHPYNRMDAFVSQVMGLDAAWAPKAARAGRWLRLTVGTRRIRLAPDGRFTLPAKACGRRVLATDDAGGQTSLPLPACHRHS